MIDLLDSGSTRLAGYVVATVVALVWGARERRRLTVERHSWWPPYWWTSALLLGVMTIARASELGDLVGEIGREQARSSGWYDGRRSVQAIAVVVVAVVWIVAVIVAVWRVPPRRRRYLPHAIGLSALMAFAAVRIISLHQVDTLLYRRDIGGVRFVAVIELTLLTATVALGIVGARFPRPVPSTSSSVRHDGEPPTGSRSTNSRSSDGWRATDTWP